MKFAKQLGLRSIPSWAPYYVDYKSLKQYIKSSFKDLEGPLDSLESVDHENEESKSTQGGQNGEKSEATVSDSLQDTDVPKDTESASPAVDHEKTLMAITATTAIKVKSQGNASPRNGDTPDSSREAALNAVGEGFKALLWAELEKVNARYEAQERVASVNLERLKASWRSNFSPAELKQWRGDLTVLILNLEYLIEFSQTNLTGFKKIVKKFDKHYRHSQSPSSTPLATSGSEQTNGNGVHDTNGTLAYLSTSVDSDPAGPLSMVNALGAHGRNTPTIYLPRDYPEPASSLHPQEPYIRNLQSPNTQAKNVFFSEYYGGISALSLEFWKMVTERTFAKSEKDERLLTEARTLWRKRTPVVQEHASPLSLGVDPKDYPVWDDLDLDSLPSGKLTRLWVVLAEDAMSTPIKVPVIVAKGARPGPVVGLTAALHGNELNGIPLTHRLVLHDIKCQSLHGIVVAVPVANVPGYLAGQRGFSDGTDLNRLMPGKKNGSTSQVYSYNLMTRIIRHFTHLIDLHTASKGRVNSLYVRANMQNATTRHMARLQNPQIIVHNTSPDGSLRGAAMQEYKIPAITVEIGDPARFQKRFFKSALLGVTNILSHLKMIEDEHEVQDYDPVVCARSYWIFTKGGGILNVLPDVNTWVRKGDVIATLHNIFGEEEHRYFAPEDGIVVGKSVDPVCQSGCRILHLGVVNDRFPEGRIDDGHQ
ncbi:hypothetical protein B0O80DRAFT_137665 [Mortierella sp. GBAus27b]|nr:hypothetical protein BGX31_009695 [Mortierella sp. GBA43]KAI8350100.1 hypothetical protein B0O80DRAFT_137665 [Mortierella sp. GBAus27b]